MLHPVYDMIKLSTFLRNWMYFNVLSSATFKVCAKSTFTPVADYVVQLQEITALIWQKICNWFAENGKKPLPFILQQISVFRLQFFWAANANILQVNGIFLQLDGIFSAIGICNSDLPKLRSQLERIQKLAKS